MTDDNVHPIRAGITVSSPPVSKGRPEKKRVTKHVAAIAANEMSRLWQISDILELAIASIKSRDGVKPGPSTWAALEAAEGLVRASIEALEPICTPEF